jgi:hypothetical protein
MKSMQLSITNLLKTVSSKPDLRFCILSVFLMFLFLPTFGQINNYTFSQTNEPYVPVQVDSSMGTATTDDQNFNGVRLGFIFRYNNQNYDRVSVNFNGFVVMGPVSGYSFSDACISVANASGRALNSTNAGSTNNLVSAFNMDLQATSYSSFGIKRTGTAPNREFTVQWRNVRRYRSSSGSDTVNFQIKLSETSNQVEFKYGRSVLAQDQTVPLLVQIGLRGNSASEFACRTSQDNWSVTSAGSSNQDGVRFSPTVNPTPGLVFRYTPLPPAPNDLAMVSILGPVSPSEGCNLSNDEKITVVVKNNGTASQNSIPVGYRINNGLVITQDFALPTPLPSGAFDTLTLSQGSNLSAIGNYKIVAFTRLGSETPLTRGNDSLLNYTLSVKPPRNLPQPIVSTLSIGQQNGWKSGRGRLRPTGFTSNWTTAFPFATESIALPFPNSTNRMQEWFYSPNINITNFSVLIFRAAITNDLFGTGAVGNIGDDTIRAMVSFDCGANWKILKSFKQNDLTNDTVSNTLREFRFKLTSQTSGTAIIAFFGTNNGTAPAFPYRFHIDDVEIREIPPFDASVSSVLRPRSASPGCVLTANEQITFIIRNNGSEAFSSLQAGYVLNGGNAVTENFTLSPTLQPGRTDTLTFSPANGVNMSTSGQYNFSVFTNLTGELPTTRSNDTLRNYRVNLTSPFAIPSAFISSFPIAQTNQWKRARGFPSFTDTVSNWSGITVIPNTPTISVFSSTTNSQLREWIYSPSYSITPDAILIASIGVTRGNTIPLPNPNMGDDTLKVMVSQDCGATWQLLRKFSQADVLTGTIKDTLKRFVFPLSGFGNKVSVGFFFQNLGTAAVSSYRVHLKDIQIRNPLLNNDLAATAILAPVNNIAFCKLTNQEKVRVVIANQGINPQTSSVIGYRIGNAPEKTATFTFTPSPLMPGKSDTVEFSGTEAADLSQYGTYVFKAYSKLSTEEPGGNINDTIRNYRIELRAPKVGSAFVEFFDANESIPLGWVPGTRLFSFQEFVNKPGRGFGGTNAMSVMLSISNPSASLNSPRYLIPPNALSSLRFKYRLVDNSGQITELRAQDSISLRYTKDCGLTYQPLMRIDSITHTLTNQYLDTAINLNGLANEEVMFNFSLRLTKTDTSRANFDLDNWIIEIAVPNSKLLSGKDGLDLFPNPTRDNVDLVSHQGPLGEVQLVDVAGRELKNWPEIEDSFIKIDLQGFRQGTYFIRIKNENGLRVKKLILTQ